MSDQSLNTENNPQNIKALHYEKIVKMMWRFFIGFFVFFFLLFFILSFMLPSFKELEDPKTSIASEIYSSDSVLLGKFFIENRTPVSYDSISVHVINALISTEDARFYSHSGIDPEALIRVAVKTMLLRNESAGGGSTISQQLAKLLVGRPDTKKMFFLFRYPTIFITKLKEWLTAIKLERSYTKKEILQIYLNQFDFLYNAYGIRSAAETYFGKHPHDLNIPEAAMLVRMLKNPSMFNFKRDMKKAMMGRKVVLKNMMDKNHITKADYVKYSEEPIDVNKFKVQDHHEGRATYFREYLREYLKDILSKYKKANGAPYDLYKDGLKIYTTINSRMQAHLEQAVWDHLSQHQVHMFKHWPDWNAINPPPGTTKQNPWSYMDFRNNYSEIELRQLNLNKLIWESERYISARNEYLKTGVKLNLTDADIYRMLRMEDADIKPLKERNSGKNIDKERLVELWKSVDFIDDNQVSKFNRIMNSSDWKSIRSEYQAIMKYMQTPVQMKIFSYIKDKNDKWRGGDKDTLLSPFDSIRYHRMFLQAGSIAVDPNNGHIKAWVGGINHNYFQLDHVSMGSLYVHPKKRLPTKNYPKVGRQVGSSIKPFLYGLTVKVKGYSPCYEVDDIKITIEKGYGKFALSKDWTPNNANGVYSGSRVTLTRALSMSLNSVSAQLMKDFNSSEPFRCFLSELGIDSTKIPHSPTICLGTPDFTPIEMTGGYTIFANGGVYREPILVTKITPKNGGDAIYSDEWGQVSDEILDPNSSYTMCQMLRQVQSGAPGFYGIKSQHGGKTGTTNFQADGWYMGITPNLVIGTWVGNDDRFIRFRNLGYGQGGSMARPIFQNMMRYVEADKKLNFDVEATYPKPDEIKEMNCGKYDKMGKGDTYDYTEMDAYEMDEKPKTAKKKKKKEEEEEIIIDR
jgi:penicillin-binding protein 1A